MTTINDAVAQSLRSHSLHGYANSAQPVVRDLVQREEGIAEAIVRAARTQGVDEQTARRALQSAGMHVAARVTDPTRVAQFPDRGQVPPNTRAAQGVDTNVLGEILDTLKKIAKRTKHLG